MTYAIEELKRHLFNLETNEPINRAAGYVDQADLEKDSAESVRNAIAVLEHAFIPIEGTFKDRVVLEKRDLDDRLKKLNAFIGTETYCSLPESEQERLSRQADYMRCYSDVLAERIEAFE